MKTSTPITPVCGRLFRVREIAQYLGVSESKARQLIRRGELPAVRTAGGRLEGVYEHDCDAWIARRRQAVLTDAPKPAAIDERIKALMPAERRFA